MLDARSAIAVTERQRYILRVRTLAKDVAQIYYNAREKLGFPLLQPQSERSTKHEQNTPADFVTKEVIK